MTVNGWTWEVSLIKKDNGYFIEENSSTHAMNIKINYNENFYQTSVLFTYSDDSTENYTFEWSTVDLSTLKDKQ